MSEHGLVVVEDSGAVRVLKLGAQRQSSMYLDSPFDTDFDYPGYFHIALALNPDIERVLAIGLGGGTMVKRMWRDYPSMRLTAVEIDQVVVEAARRFFELPDDERLRVETGDGRQYLESSSATFDLIVVDAFDGEAVPLPLLTEEFCREARDHLSEGGVLAYNVHGSLAGERSKPFRSQHRTLSNVFSQVWTFAVELSQGGSAGEHREIIIFATDSSTTRNQLLARIADRVGGRVSIPAFEQLGAELHETPVRTGDVPLLLDPPKRAR
jgi:spermidine synthase